MLTGSFTVSASFFFLQPLAIIAERVLVGDAILKSGIGYIWVLGWFSWCAVGMVDGLVGAGLGKGELVPISVWRGLAQGDWAVGL